MLLADEDVGNGALTRDLLKGGLNITSVGLLIELNGVVFGTGGVEELLRGLAVGTV